MTIKGYTQEQLNYIKKNYDNKTIKDLCKDLDKTYNSISNAIRKLGLTKQMHNKWTNEEINFLKDHFVDMTSEEISKYVNHSIDAINTQRDKLNLVRNENWTKKEVSFLMQNFEIMTHSEIGKKLNRTEQAVRAKCFELNLYKKEKPWTDEEIEFVKNNYINMPTSDIATILNRTPNAIKLKARKNGIKKYPYYCNYNFFDSIDTEEKAYWLGFLTADGWINKNTKTNAGALGIELQYNDIGHLKKFNKSISGNYKITDRWRECQISTKDKNKKNHTCCIRIFSLVMYNSLVNIGFTNNKTYDANIPFIPKDLIRHYIRGYFDGDGCFTYTAKSFNIRFVTASNKLYVDLLKILETIKINVSTSSYISEFNSEIYNIDINRKKDKIQFLDWIYKDCNIYLDRKYKKYLKVKNIA